MVPFDFEPRTRVVFGRGTVERVGQLAKGFHFQRTLLVADRGLVKAGHVAAVTAALESDDVAVVPFHDFGENPDSQMIESGRRFAEPHRVDSIVALGGGSSLDCAKGINFVLTNGGSMRDYRGHNKAARPMLPSIGIPTTAGTGSEAQSYALISDAETHAKMACGDDKAAFRIAILDPALTVSQPAAVTAVAGYDAISHAVEAYVTKNGTDESRRIAAEAWALLEANYERVLKSPTDLPGRGAMLKGANLAGAAIELSMLGAAHACANPLTARYGTTHGIGIAVMLPHVVRWNGAAVGDLYARLLRASGRVFVDDPAQGLASRLEQLRTAGKLPSSLRETGAREEDIPALAGGAATQGTGTHNPRAFSEADAVALYRAAWGSPRGSPA